VQYQPLGVVGVISPWNFPMNVMCRKTLPALLTGNTVVFKPASFTPWSGVFMAKLFELAGVPPGVFNCVTGLGSAIGNVLVQDPRVRAVSFTGSTEVGKKIQALAAENLTRTQLELGGKNALIVMDDAEIGEAVEAAVTAGFSNAGQWCTSTSRILLHRGIAAPFPGNSSRAAGWRSATDFDDWGRRRALCTRTTAAIRRTGQERDWSQGEPTETQKSIGPATSSGPPCLPAYGPG
jgi:acyl-CoA reductase-like NAD-dependent aldehyde dehydrogenase